MTWPESEMTMHLLKLVKISVSLSVTIFRTHMYTPLLNKASRKWTATIYYID